MDVRSNDADELPVNALLDWQSLVGCTVGYPVYPVGLGQLAGAEIRSQMLNFTKQTRFLNICVPDTGGGRHIGRKIYPSFSTSP